MIRTNSVKLSVIPALAYRQKLTAGGSSIVILRADEPAPGIATISKSSGEPIISKNTNANAYPAEAFREAMELTAGMPYRKQGKPRVIAQELNVAEEVVEALAEEPVPEAEVVVDSADYQTIADAYTDKNGKFSYTLLNKDLIQTAHSSEMVSRMLAAGESEETIRLFVVGNRFRAITGNKNLTDEQVLKIAELLNETSPKGIFKDFNADLRSQMSASKRG